MAFCNIIECIVNVDVSTLFCLVSWCNFMKILRLGKKVMQFKAYNHCIMCLSYHVFSIQLRHTHCTEGIWRRWLLSSFDTWEASCAWHGETESATVKFCKKPVWKVLRPCWSKVSFDGLVMLSECQTIDYQKLSSTVNWRLANGNVVGRSCVTKMFWSVIWRQLTWMYTRGRVMPKITLFGGKRSLMLVTPLKEREKRSTWKDGGKDTCTPGPEIQLKTAFIEIDGQPMMMIITPGKTKPKPLNIVLKSLEYDPTFVEVCF